MFVVKTENFIVLFFIFLKIFTEGHPRIPFPSEQRLLLTDGYHGQSPMVGERPGPQQPEKMFRLSDNLKPISYNLKLIPYLETNFTFSGQVNISLLVTRSTKNIILHSSNLNITSLEVYRGNQKIACNFSLLPKDEILSILSQTTTFYRRFVVEVRIKFQGLLNDRPVGFYRSSYRVGNTTKWLATTQFEHIYARWAFPCFDEPKFRATFNVTIARYPYQQAISNMPLKSTSLMDPSINNRVWDSFETTPPMPTYLVAFIVSEFKHRADTEKNIQLWASENVIDNTTYALQQISPLKKILEKFLQVPYNLPKLDVAAIPTFSWVGMENWGLITFREWSLLWNEKFDSERKKSYITSIMAHELSHQWFGDLVTIAWWDYLWLKEGFATYFEYFSTALKEPSWRYDELFVVEELHYSLKYDGFDAKSPMTTKIRSKSDFNWEFYFASYDKAASVIRMIEHVVSPVTFKNALNLFLVSRKNSGGVADPSHLYEAFEKQMLKEHKFLPQGIKITSVFKSFAEQVGYPCVTVSRISDHTGQKIDVEIKQELYTTKSSKKIPERTWYVPLSCTKQSELNFNKTEPSIWLTNASKIIISKEVEDDEWYLCNIKQTGYYRVNYDLKNWQLLIKQLHSSPMKIHPLNRAQLIEDCFTFANDDHLPLSVLFDLFRYLEFEVDPIPWFTSLYKLYYWSQQFENTMVSSDLKQFAKHLIEHYYNHVGFYGKPSDCHLTKIMRTSLTFVASILDVKDAVTKANAEFNEKAELRNISLSVRDTVFCTAIRTNSNMTVWNRLWDMFRKANDTSEKSLVLRSFGCASTEDLLKKFIFKLVNPSDSDIPKNLEGSVYCSAQRFQRGITASLNFILDMMPQFGNYTKAYDVVMRLLRHMDERIQSNEQIHLLDRVIEESKKLDQHKYGDIAKVANTTKETGLKKIKKNNEIAEKMFAVLGKKEETTTTPATKTTSSVPGPSTTSKPVPSSATYFTPSAISIFLPYLFVTAIYW